MKNLKLLIALLCCSLTTGCATPNSAYFTTDDWLDNRLPASETVSVNQLLANARKMGNPLKQLALPTVDAFLQQPQQPQQSQQSQILLVFKSQSTVLTIADQRRLQLFSQSMKQPQLSIQCGAAGEHAFDDFRIALHRCQNIQRFYKLILQDTVANITAVQPLMHTRISAHSASGETL